jgi:hypothetical protein
MANVLSAITTPLALAALLLLLGAGAVRIILRGARPSIAKQMINYGFALALALGALANVSYILVEHGKTELLINGTVRSDQGRYIPNAIVNLPGKGRGITSDDGEFALSIPTSRGANEYEAIVTAPGYSTVTKKIVGPGPTSIDVTLSAIHMSAEDIVVVAPQAVAAQYVGTPELDLLLTFQNELAEPIQISDLAVRITAPDGTHRDLALAGESAGPGLPLGAPVPTLTVPANQSSQQIPLRLYYLFMTTDSDLIRLSQSAAAELQPLIQSSKPLKLSDSLTAEFVKRANEAFYWRPGSWSVDLLFTCKGVPEHVRRRFDLPVESVDRMKRVAGYYHTGMDTVLGFHQAAINSDAQPAQIIQLLPTPE